MPISANILYTLPIYSSENYAFPPMGISHCICNLYLNLFNVSPLKHGNPVSSINATKATISSWYGLKTKTNIFKNTPLAII
jgi:hypothetical protein